MHMQSGDVIHGRYRLERVLGSGGMGTVWAAIDLETRDACAVKLMKEQPDDPDARRRFLREARAAAAVHHRNVIQIFDVVDQEPPAIVMELLDGESLRARLDREPVPTLAELCDWFVDVCSAVGSAHEKGIVHRDLKPENIFLAGGCIKVLDFGIAKLTALDGDAMRSTGISTNLLVGTPAYMAPEQVFAERDIDHRADVWALGIVLYEALSGVCPTAGDNIGQVLKHVVSRPFERLADLAPAMPEELVAMVTRMIERDRERRPSDLREVQEVLERFATHKDTPIGRPVVAVIADRARKAEVFQNDDGRSDTAPATPHADTVRASPRRAHPRHVSSAASTPASGRRRRRWPLVAVGACGVAITGVVVWWVLPSASQPPLAMSPLASPTATLACPMLRSEPESWLGAAASSVACERARLILGGTHAVLPPAELLGLPHGPTDTFPAYPYGAIGAHDRSVEAARQRAQAYLDGDVRMSSGRFAVILTLRTPDGRVVASGTGNERALYAAVREALDGLVGPDGLPRATLLDPSAAAWERTSDIDAALANVDAWFAFAHNAGQLPDECARFSRYAAELHEVGAETSHVCDYTLGRPSAPLILSTSKVHDDSAAATAMRIRITHSWEQTQKPDDRTFIHALRGRETTPRGESLLAAIESCLIGDSDPATARELAIVSVQVDPANPAGGLCNPWEQLRTLERGTPSATASIHAFQAWQPWNSYAWFEHGLEPDPPAAIAMLRRANDLSPFDAQVAVTLGGSLLASGDRAAARGVALALQTGGLPVHEVGSNTLLVRIEASELRFGAALARARRTAVPTARDAGWLLEQRFDIGWFALQLGELLGRDHDVADWLIATFLTPEPSPLDSHVATIPMRIPAICVHASTPDKCFARYHELRSHFAAERSADTDGLLAGAERYVAHDYAGAAASWRVLLSGKLALASALTSAMVDTFERTNAPDLAERIDQAEMLHADVLGGATLAHVRAAKRAAARGERARAKDLAAHVVTAWQLADEVPPAVAQMKQLVAR